MTDCTLHDLRHAFFCMTAVGRVKRGPRARAMIANALSKVVSPAMQLVAKRKLAPPAVEPMLIKRHVRAANTHTAGWIMDAIFFDWTL